LWGPFAPDEETADALFSHLLTVLPTTITLIQSYLNVDNQWGDAFYRRHGFGQAKVSHVYIAPRPGELCQPDELLPEVTADQAASFAQLHDITFPNTFYSSQDILGMLNETNKVFVWAKDDEALGYLYAKVDESTGEGYVEFVGVAEQAQRQGIGRKLLATAVYWLFHDQQVPQIALNVNDDNNNARNLYESTGFHLEYAGVALKRAR
jgi:ribosomal protein S18 acetylase RimI-like enzyme